MRYGYKASAEQFDPTRLLEYSQLAASLGLQLSPAVEKLTLQLTTTTFTQGV